MKFFIVFTLVIASALAYVSNDNNNNNNNDNNPAYEGSNEWNSSPRNGNTAPSDVNGLTAENLGAIFQRQSQQRHQVHRTRGPSSNTNNADDDSSLGYWASYPDSAAFDAKIKARLSTSRALIDKPEVRRKIAQLAEEKFNQCKVLIDDRERACLGRVTGQMMQLVSAVENMARNPQL